MKLYWLILGVLTVWRITHLLQAEDGPWDLVVWLRRAVGNGFWGKLLDCFHCLSLWVSAPTACLLGRGWKEGVFLWLSLSGGAILLEQLTRRESVTTPTVYYEDEETEHVLLRKSENEITGDQAKPPNV
jgi:hypothetical protein